MFKMVSAEIVGFVAAAFTTAALAPQAVKSWKTKLTRDVSLWWITTLILGMTLWFTYGILIDSTPLIFANIISLILAVSILVSKIRYK